MCSEMSVIAKELEISSYIILIIIKVPLIKCFIFGYIVFHISRIHISSALKRVNMIYRG